MCICTVASYASLSVCMSVTGPTTLKVTWVVVKGHVGQGQPKDHVILQVSSHQLQVALLANYNSVNSPITAPTPTRAALLMFLTSNLMVSLTFLVISQSKMVSISFCKKPLEVENDINEDLAVCLVPSHVVRKGT